MAMPLSLVSMPLREQESASVTGFTTAGSSAISIA